jgi:hypothetical protein
MNQRLTGRSVILMMIGLSSCGSQPSKQPEALPAPTQPCDRARGTVDRTFAVEQARRALSQPGVTLKVDSIQVVRGQGIELGLIISLLSETPPVVGGGGLVWVDVETGCPIVLRRYE